MRHEDKVKILSRAKHVVFVRAYRELCTWKSRIEEKAAPRFYAISGNLSVITGFFLYVYNRGLLSHESDFLGLATLFVSMKRKKK